MSLSDKMWEKLRLATEPFEGIDRETVESGLSMGDYTLFESGDSVAITTPLDHTLRIGLAGGDLEELVNLEKQIVKYAYKEGFKMLEIIGRPGWEKALPGYDRIAVILRKEVGYGLH